MKIKLAWAVQSFLLCFLFNLVLAAVILFFSDKIVLAMNDWLTPFIGPGASALPDEMRTALGSFAKFALELRGYLLPVLATLVSSVTLLLWFFVYLAGGRQIRRAGEQASTAPCEKPGETEPEPSLSTLDN